jgi:hypothetical protein
MPKTTWSVRLSYFLSLLLSFCLSWYEFGERRWNYMLAGENRRTRRKTCPSATISTTNPTWIDPGVNPGLRSERPATNDMSHGMALEMITMIFRIQKVRGVCAWASADVTEEFRWPILSVLQDWRQGFRLVYDRSLRSTAFNLVLYNYAQLRWQRIQWR